MTVRLKFVQKTKEKQSKENPAVLTEIYKVNLIDVHAQGFLLLKLHQNRKCNYAVGDTYLCDKIKLIINANGEIVLASSSLTVLSSESDESIDVASLDLSQKQHDQDFLTGNEMLATNADSKAINFIILEEGSTEPPIFTSIKQIHTRSRQILDEWSPDLKPKLWSFKEILCWKIPEHVLSTTARETQKKLQQKQHEEGYICSYAMHTHLYQLDMVTQRIKE